eukprot:227188_1
MFRVHAGNTVMNNIAASGSGAGYLSEGDSCDNELKWSNNYAHSMRDGMLVADKPAENDMKWEDTGATPKGCRKVGGLMSYWNSDNGLVAWYVIGNVQVADYVSVDNQI